MVKYAPRKVYIKEKNVYVELSYKDFCYRREADQRYMDKLFIPVQGCLLEVVREQYADFYKDKERWHYLKKLDTQNGLLSLDGFTDSEDNVIDFIVDEAVDVTESAVHAVMADREKQTEIRSVSDLLDEIENETLYFALMTVDRRTLQIILLKMQGYSIKEIAPLVHLTAGAVYARLAHLRKKLRKIL